MGLSIHFTGAADGGDGPFSLATASGWAAFAAWADALPPEFAAVRGLAETGAATGTDALAGQLRAALDRQPPASEGVAHTAAGLLELLGVGDPHETAAVTHGDAVDEPAPAHAFAETVTPPVPSQPFHVTLTAPDPELPGVVRELVDAIKNPPAPVPAAEFDIIHERDGEGRIVRSRRVPPKGSV